MTRPPGHPPVVLSIAGSDPSGGAGIQADLKTFGALGGYGCAVLTALTAQNTRGVSGLFAVPAAFVRDQVQTLLDDVTVDAAKIGMLADAEIACAVADLATGGRIPYVVLDPVMVASSGRRLLDPVAERLLRTRLMPSVDLITPNVDEAAALLGGQVALTLAEARSQAVALRALGARRVLLTGGHLDSVAAVDVFCDEHGTLTEISGPRIRTRNTHGTGCTLSAAIAVLRPTAPDWLTAVEAARSYLTVALRRADELVIGDCTPDPYRPAGHGPVNHLAALWDGQHRVRPAG